MSASAAAVVSALASARRGAQLYPPSHPAHAAAMESLVAVVYAAAMEGSLVLNWFQGRLYHDSIVIGSEVTGAQAIAEAFEDRRIESLAFDPSFDAEAAAGLVEVLSLRPDATFDVEAELASRNITSVRVSTLLDDDDDERAERERQRQADRALYQRALVALRNLQQRFAESGSGDLGETPGVVQTILERMLADPSAVLGLTTIRDTSEPGLFHALNVMIYALALGQRLGLPEEGLASLGLSALLHDIGKSAFTQDADQAEAMRVMHPGVGAEILQRLALEDPGPMLVAYEHHVRHDGGGWPEQEAGYVSHPFSRMVAVANRYENLVGTASATEPLTPDKAIINVLRECGTVLDPFFGRLLASALGIFPVGCVVRLEDQSVGVVARPGTDPLAPVVRIAFDEMGAELETPLEVDLTVSGGRILEVLDPDVLRLSVSEKL